MEIGNSKNTDESLIHLPNINTVLLLKRTCAKDLPSILIQKEPTCMHA